MNIKTKGKCPNCGKMYAAAEAGAHLLTCALQSKMTEGYLIRISWVEQPGMYWIFATIPKNATLELLDTFLRGIWLECCGHLSEFTIDDRHYMSYTESGDLSLKYQIGKLLSLGDVCQYAYDMGSTTELEIQVLAEVNACQKNKVTLLMRNDSPTLPCESCKKSASAICSLCGDKVCTTCSDTHTCVEEEGDDYMLMPVVNSPRTGVCAYEGT